MQPVFDLVAVDVDGAIQEAEGHAAGDTRAAFFRKAAIGGGTLLTSGAIMGMLPELAAAKPSKKQDLAILNFALTLEYLEAAFYQQAVANGKGFKKDVAAFAALVAQHEAAHVKALKQTIRAFGGRPVKSPTFDFKGTPDREDTFLSTAFVLENTGVHAYLGQAGRLYSRKLLGAAASIVTIEARHASAVATLLADNAFTPSGAHSITPDGAYDTPLSKKKILAAVGGTGFITG